MTTEIKFKRDTTLRNSLFTPESFSHPAKMDSQLLIWLVEKYTQIGETILDPMLGSGTTLLACTLGRNVIGIELEAKFRKMASDNWDKVKQMPQLGYGMGNCQIVNGDARNLSGIMADKVLFSPPYDECLGDKHDSPSHQRLLKEKGIPTFYTNSADKIITSPPYENSATGENRDELWERIAADPSSARAGRKSHPKTAEAYTVDSIVTSPPYSESIHPTGESQEKVIANNDPAHLGKNSQCMLVDGYSSDNKSNIGNLKGQTYLDQMLLVYRECFKVLKPGGLLILVTKNYIRNQKEIRLDLDTIKLCETAGFTFIERHYRKLAGQSFWRVIYRQKFPEAPVLDKEDILVFERASQKVGQKTAVLQNEKQETI